MLNGRVTPHGTPWVQVLREAQLATKQSLTNAEIASQRPVRAMRGGALGENARNDESHIVEEITPEQKRGSISAPVLFIQMLATLHH